MKNLDLPQISPTNRNENFLLEIMKLLHEVDANTPSTTQETLEFKMTITKRNFNFEKLIFNPDKWLMGMLKLHVYNTVCNINKRINLRNINLAFLNKSLLILKNSRTF